LDIKNKDKRALVRMFDKKLPPTDNTILLTCSHTLKQLTTSDSTFEASIIAMKALIIKEALNMGIIREEDPIIEFLKGKDCSFDQLHLDSKFLVDTKQVAEPSVDPDSTLHEGYVLILVHARLCHFDRGLSCQHLFLRL